MLNEKQGNILLRLARQTIAKHLNLPVSEPVEEVELADPGLQAKRGVFVTLNKHGALRGCIGSLVGQESIIDGVRRHALNAAFHDSRFPPVTADEVPSLRIDVSVLSEPRPLEYRDDQDLVRKLRPHVDGVILRAPGGAGATFLPQVWDQLPDPQLFLSRLCLKAGLPQMAWQSGQLEIDTYQVQHFEEKE
ncbi:MAG TPA: AmmeMemoRadiSam system protein A [Desulfobulbaceae bacterium]|nr:AmmeMemoRadiSam system protein A [Desulfobulbaceae bacterium]